MYAPFSAPPYKMYKQLFDKELVQEFGIYLDCQKYIFVEDPADVRRKLASMGSQAAPQITEESMETWWTRGLRNELSELLEEQLFTCCMRVHENLFVPPSLKAIVGFLLF